MLKRLKNSRLPLLLIFALAISGNLHYRSMASNGVTVFKDSVGQQVNNASRGTTAGSAVASNQLWTELPIPYHVAKFAIPEIPTNPHAFYGGISLVDVSTTPISTTATVGTYIKQALICIMGCSYTAKAQKEVVAITGAKFTKANCRAWGTADVHEQCDGTGSNGNADSKLELTLGNTLPAGKYSLFLNFVTHNANTVFDPSVSAHTPIPITLTAGQTKITIPATIPAMYSVNTVSQGAITKVSNELRVAIARGQPN